MLRPLLIPVRRCCFPSFVFLRALCLAAPQPLPLDASQATHPYLRSGYAKQSLQMADLAQARPAARRLAADQSQGQSRAGGKCQAKHHAEGCNEIGTDSDHSVSGDGNSWATFNGFQTLAIKQRQKERKRRAMHGIVKSGSIPPKQIRDRSNLLIVRRFRQRHDFV